MDLARLSRVVEVCERVSRYVCGALARYSRLRVVAIKELLRVATLACIAPADRDHATTDERQAATRIRRAVSDAVLACLQDDERRVRYETLRAVSVMLRNVSVAVHATAAALAHVFPRGLGSVDWILRPIATALNQIGGFTSETALTGSAWYHLSVLIQLFRLFPDHTLTLCDYLLRAGLGLRLIRMCRDGLRSAGLCDARTRARIDRQIGRAHV